MIAAPAQTLNASSVSEEVYRAIRGAILDLTLEPGSTISENALARELGASRTPVREAIQRLERERLLFVFPQRGTVVAPLDLDEFRSAYFVRSSLECAAAADAARRAGPADVARLHHHVEEHTAALAVEDESTFFALNDAFHFEIMTIAGVPSVWSVVQNAKVHLDRVRIAHLTRASNYPLAPIVDEHRQLVAAIAAGAADEAAAIMHAHIAKVLHRVDLLRDLRPELFEMPRELTAQIRAISRPTAAGRRLHPNDKSQ